MVALVLRIGVIELVGANRVASGDGPDYLAAARRLCFEHQYPDHSSLPFFRAPGLPFFIAGVTGCHPDSVWLVKIALAIVGALGVFAAWGIARRLGLSQGEGLVAAWLTSLYPFFVFESADIETEGLFMVLVLASVLWQMRAAERSVFGFWSGMAAGLAALTRPVGLLLFLLLPLWNVMTIRPRVGASFRRAVPLFAAGLLATVGLWGVRNWERLGEVIAVNDASGYNFWRGTSEEIGIIEHLHQPLEFNNASLNFETKTWPPLEARIDRATGSLSSTLR